MHTARRNAAQYLEKIALCILLASFEMFGIFIVLSFKMGCFSAAEYFHCAHWLASFASYRHQRPCM